MKLWLGYALAADVAAIHFMNWSMVVLSIVFVLGAMLEAWLQDERNRNR